MNLVEYITRHRTWSEATFGTGARVGGLLTHIQKECEEIRANPTDLEEWIDVIILAIDGAWRAGHSPVEIAAMLEFKLGKNQARIWNVSPDPNIPNEHVRVDADFHL